MTKAVMPKLMTMAVSTSAWGRGSAVGPPLPAIGGAPLTSRPVANRNRLTA